MRPVISLDRPLTDFTEQLHWPSTRRAQRGCVGMDSRGRSFCFGWCRWTAWLPREAGKKCLYSLMAAWRRKQTRTEKKTILNNSQICVLEEKLFISPNSSPCRYRHQKTRYKNHFEKDYIKPIQSWSLFSVVLGQTKHLKQTPKTRVTCFPFLAASQQNSFPGLDMLTCWTILSSR